MASLYHRGLINGFYARRGASSDLMKPCAPPTAGNMLRIDLSTGEAMDSFHGTAGSLVARLRADGVGPGFVRVAVRTNTWTEVRRSGGPDSPIGSSWFALQIDAASVEAVQATLWCEHPHEHCVFAVVSARVMLPRQADDTEWWIEGDLDYYSDDLKHAVKATRDDFRDELIYMTRVAFVLHLLDEYDMLVADRAAPHRLTFSEQRRLERQTDPGARKRLLRDTVVREASVYLSAARAEQAASEAVAANEWVEFDPLAERRAAGTLPYTPRRQHEVGGFTRFLKKSGKTVPVRAHVRGNPLLGTVKRMKNVIIEQ